jgi:hypothetical protein
MDTKSIIVENVTLLPKSAAKIAAGMLVLLGHPVTYDKDVRRLPQAKVFVEGDTFIQPQRGAFATVIGTTLYNSAKDVRRRPQDKTFIEGDTFAQPQRGFLLATLTTYGTPLQIQQSVSTHVIENTSWAKPQRGSLNVVLAQLPPVPQSSDIFVGQDTYGWPPDPVDFFSPGQRGTLNVLQSFTAYNPATDVRRASQAKVFIEPDSYIQPQHINYVVNNTVPYNPGRDVTRLARQAKVFIEGDTFIQPRAPLANAIKFTPYAFATDVRRARQQQFFVEPDTQHRPQPFNELITNGTAAPPVSVQILGVELDVLEATRGTVTLAWTPFPFSNLVTYQVYVNEVAVQTGITSPRVATIAGLQVDTLYAIKIVGFPQGGFPRQSNQVLYQYGTTEIMYFTRPSQTEPAPDA